VRLISVSRDISERREAETVREKLLANEKEARRDAETANRMRDEFLATVSHELRNPLNAMLGWARLLQKNQLDEINSQKAVDAIVRNAEAQNRLIEDLLDVSRIVAGKLRLDIATIQPKDFVEAAINTVKPAAEAKDIKIRTFIDDDLNKISGDTNRLQQVVWNLLSNAIKFTPKHGEVNLSVQSLDSMIEIRVKDNGIGITPDFLPHVFDRFRQGDSSTVKKFSGLGLGLAIVRHITEMHGGIVEVFSEGDGKGATFTVKLPIAAITVQTEQVESNKGIESDSFVKEPSIDLNGLFILTVDDEPDTCQLLEQVLTHYGANVKSTNSASEALSEFMLNTPDILISDIGMPEEDGYSLIQKIRAIPDAKKMPAIALTAFARPQDRMKALAAGFQTHVSKPVEPDELATVIASLTGRLSLNDLEDI
ncbi:MAG TPA: ATP-binding protein, partial [Pyrinomonadaceae bacterium]|nr:ATP-binding protein [Pyrinomonadaceae bacterium]